MLFGDFLGGLLGSGQQVVGLKLREKNGTKEEKMEKKARFHVVSQQMRQFPVELMESVFSKGTAPETTIISFVPSVVLNIIKMKIIRHMFHMVFLHVSRRVFLWIFYKSGRWNCVSCRIL